VADVQINWFTFAAQLINFLILLVLLRKFLYHPIMTAMDNREKRITDRLKEARQQKADAEKEKKEYESQRIALEKKQDEMMQQAKTEVAEEKKALLQQARTEVEATKKKWKEALDREQEAFMRQFRERAAHQIMETVRKVALDLANAELESQVIHHFLDRLDEQSQEQRDAMTQHLRSATAPLTVKTGFSVSDEDHSLLEESLKQWTNGKHAYTFEQDEDLGFGIELHTDGWKMAWSLQDYLDELEQQVQGAYTNRSG
jgi:F-type H+-transporting ATPase subunit b